MSITRTPCPQCAYMNKPESRWCKRCKVELATVVVEKSSVKVSSDERKARLNGVKTTYLADGYRVVHETDFTVQLVKPKEFNLLIALLGLLFFVVGLFIYLLVYASEKDKTVYLSVDEFGNIERR